MKRFWFFDLDGTLADTDGDIRLAWKGAMKDLGLKCVDFDAKFVAGPPIEEMTKKLFPEIYSDRLALDIRVGFGRHYDNDGLPNTCEYPGVLDRIRALKSAGARPFVVTNKRYVGAKAIAAKFGWASVFEAIYAGDMYKDDPAIGKLRKPELLARVMREVGADRSDCVMVGDTANDFEAARKNGVESIGVAWGYGTRDELAEADRIADGPEDL